MTETTHLIDTSDEGDEAASDAAHDSVHHTAHDTGHGAVHDTGHNTASDAAAASMPVAPMARRLLYVAAVLVFLAGLQLFVFPLRTDTYFAWTIKSPMTAVFLGASYWSAVGLEIAAARASNWAGARIAIPTVFVFTVTTLVVTVVHVDLFHFGGEHPAKTQMVTWAWLLVYTVVPVLMVMAVVRQRRLFDVVTATRPGAAAGSVIRPRTAPDSAGAGTSGLGVDDTVPGGASSAGASSGGASSGSASSGSGNAQALPTVVRLTLVVLTIILLCVGASLLIRPEWGDGAWPWTLTPLTARAIGAWLIGLAVAAGDARLLDDRRSLFPLGVTGVLFGVLQTLALARYGDLVNGGATRVIPYVAVLSALTIVSVWAVVDHCRHLRRIP